MAVQNTGIAGTRRASCGLGCERERMTRRVPAGKDGAGWMGKLSRGKAMKDALVTLKGK